MKKKYYITLGKTTRTDIFPDRLGSSQKRICLNQWILRLLSTTELLSHICGSKYHTCSHTFIWNRSSTQKLDLVHFLLKFGRPGQLGNHFWQPSIYLYHVQIISDSQDAFKIILDFLWYFKTFSPIFWPFFPKFSCPGQLGKHFGQPTSYFTHVQIILITKMHLKTISDFR